MPYVEDIGAIYCSWGIAELPDVAFRVDWIFIAAAAIAIILGFVSTGLVAVFFYVLGALLVVFYVVAAVIAKMLDLGR